MPHHRSLTRFLHPLCLIGLLWLSACGQREPEPDGPAAGADRLSGSADQPTLTLRPESLPYITVREVRPETFGASISAPARVDFRAQAISTAGTLVAGRINKIHVQIGDRIKAGAPLATLVSSDAMQMRSDFARAEAELARAEDRRRRQMEMQKAGVGLEVERVEAETQLKQARAELERSREFLRLLGDGNGGEVIVRAPIDSVVLKSDVSMGAAVEPGAPLFDLGEPSAAWIIADVFEKDLLLVEKGAKAVIELASQPDPIHGQVVAESAAIQSDLRRASVFIVPDDPKIPLRPGMYARVSIEVSAPNRVILPTSAVLIKDGRETIVYVEIAPGTFQARPVQVDQAREGMTPVLKGLSGGERVVVSGALLLDSEATMLQ